nr:MAG TPA_asm: hypothetical protein [Bacteriophage sp.]
MRFVFFYFYELGQIRRRLVGCQGAEVRQLIPWGGGVERSGSGAAHPSEFPKN